MNRKWSCQLNKFQPTNLVPHLQPTKKKFLQFSAEFQHQKFDQVASAKFQRASSSSQQPEPKNSSIPIANAKKIAASNRYHQNTPTWKQPEATAKTMQPPTSS